MEHSFLIWTTLRYPVTEFPQPIESQLSSPTDEHTLDEKSFSVSELLRQFLAFVTLQVAEGEYDAKGTYEDVLRLFLSKFDGRFLQSHEANAGAAPLPGAPAKRLNVVK